MLPEVETLERTLARVPKPDTPEGWCISAGQSREHACVTLDGMLIASVTLMGAGPAAVARVAILPSCPPIDEHDLLMALGFATVISIRLSRTNKLFPPGKSTFESLRELLPPSSVPPSENHNAIPTADGSSSASS